MWQRNRYIFSAAYLLGVSLRSTCTAMPHRRSDAVSRARCSTSGFHGMCIYLIYIFFWVWGVVYSIDVWLYGLGSICKQVGWSWGWFGSCQEPGKVASGCEQAAWLFLRCLEERGGERRAACHMGRCLSSVQIEVPLTSLDPLTTAYGEQPGHQCQGVNAWHTGHHGTGSSAWGMT